MLSAVVAHQSLGDHLLGVLASSIPQCSQLVRIALAFEDLVNDPKPSHARDVRDHQVQLQIHQIKRLLHVPDVITCVVDEHPPLTYEGTQGQHRRIRPERSVEQAVRVQALNPLAVHHVCLLLVPPSDASRIDQLRRQPARFQNFHQRDPIHTGSLDGHRLDATRHQPVRHRIEVFGKRPEDAYWLLVTIFRH